MTECCRNCKFYRNLYVPPVKPFDGIPRNGKICTLDFLDDVMLLGFGDWAGDNMCEEYTENERHKIPEGDKEVQATDEEKGVVCDSDV